MEEEVQKIWTLSKADRIQNVDYAIGVEITNLYCLMKEDPLSIPENFEDLILALIVINKGQISITNAHLIALICVFYYKRQNPPNYWKLIPVLTEEVKKLRKPSIYILGLLSRRLCDGFKSQLPAPIQYLLKTNDENLFPLICQCFRRIIKGTGTFLIQQIPDIFGFIFAGSSSTNETIRIESVKSIPVLLEYAHISIKKLLPIIGQLLPYTSKEMRFAVSKSLAKLIFIGAKLDSNPDGKTHNTNIADTIIKDTNKESDEKSKESSIDANTNPFKYGFKIILPFAQNDKNVETLALTMHILLRFFQPIEIIKKLRTFTNFILCLPSMKLPTQSVVFLSNGIIRAVISVVGSTIGNSICYHLIETIKNTENDKNRRNIDNLNYSNEQKAAIALTALINFDASTKVTATAAKQFYPLLSSGRKDIQKVCLAFFSKLGQKEENLGRIFIDTFCSFLVTIDDSRVNDIDGFSKAAASIIASFETSSKIPDSSIEKVKKVVTSFLDEKNYSTCKMSMAYLLLAALAKNSKASEMLPSVFNFTQTYLKSLLSKPVDKYMKKTIKYLSLYFLQIIMNPPRIFEKLKSTIRGFILIFLPNFQILSKSGQFLFLRLTRSWFEISPSNNDKINDFIVRSFVNLFQASFEKETHKSFMINNPSNTSTGNSSSMTNNHICCNFQLNSSMTSIENDLCNIFSADIGCFLYNFETPSNSHASHIDVVSLIEIFNIKPPSANKELQSGNDFFLVDLPFWVSKCTTNVLNEVVPPLFEFTKLNSTQIIAKLKLLSSFISSRRDLGLSNSYFDKLISLEQSTRTTSSAISKSQEPKFKQIQFALAETVSQWFISHSTFSDVKLVNNSDLNILMNNKNKFFSSLLIAFTSQYLCDEIQVQALLFLMQNIQTDGNSLMMFSLRHLLSEFKLISDFSAQVGNFLEHISYSNTLVQNQSSIKEFTNCVLTVSNKLNFIQMIRIIQNLLHFPTNSNFARFNGLIITSAITKYMKSGIETGNLVDSLVSNSLFDYQREINLSLQTPLPILMAAFSSQKVVIPTLDEVPLLFMILQQFSSLHFSKLNLNEEVINDCILRVFNADCNVKKWTNFAKRIVIIGCVPPAERKGDIRILPTSSVLICAIKIAVLLVSQIRATMELRCVDDIVSIAFTAIHMENRKIDFHCYSILSSVITCFEDVRNQEGSLLDVYFSQFHPTFCHAFDEGKRELQSVASYVIAYFRYVQNNRKNLIDEVSSILVNGLKKMKFDSESLIVFCRIASLVKDSKDQQFDEMFIKSASIFLKDVLMQKRLLVELKEELPNFITKYQTIKKSEFIPDRILLALLLSELEINCNSTNLNAVTNLEAIMNDNEAIDFVLKTVANSNLLIEEADEEERIRTAMKENEKRQAELYNSINSSNKNEIQNTNINKNNSDDFDNASFDVVDDDFVDNDIDQSAFWVYPIKKPSSVNRFLVKITNSCIIENLFEETLKLSLSSPICFASICNMLKTNNEIMNSKKYSALIASTVLKDEVGDECLALFKFMFDHLKVQVIDYIVPIIVSSEKLTNEKRFEILRYAFLKLNGFEFYSVNIVVSFLQDLEILLPYGINFIGSLLVSPHTSLTAIYILQSGLLSPIAMSTVSPRGVRILPRILHFFNTTLGVVKKICDQNDYRSFSVLVSRVALVSLAQVADVKEKAAVVKPACLLIKNIDKDIISDVFNSGRLRKKAILSVKPQKQAETIQLLTFADVKNRKSNNGGWQNLEIESDED